MMPKVDTFEHDIAEEIKRKDASLTEISTAKNDIGNDPMDTAKKPAPVLLIIMVIVFIMGLLGLLGLLYYYFTDSLLPPSQGSVPVTQSDIPKVSKALSSISSTLDTAIGRYVSGLEKQDAGYIVTITSYPAVFAYVARNEDDFIGELGNAVSYVQVGTIPGGAPKNTDVSASSTKATATTTPSVASSTTATTTKKNTSSTTTPATATSASTTTSTSTQGVAATTTPYYYDITIANQNMRVWKNGQETVVYAFITTNKLAISRTTEGILALKSVIIR